MHVWNIFLNELPRKTIGTFINPNENNYIFSSEVCNNALVGHLIQSNEVNDWDINKE